MMMTSRAHASNPDASPESWLAEKPFTLALSGGFFGFFAHAGVLSALHEAGLQPARVVGVSSGALAGGLFAAGVPAETLAETFLQVRRSDFWDRAFPWIGLLPGHKFEAKLREILAPYRTDRHEDCPTPFASVACDLRLRPRVLDSGSLTTSIRASCAIPPLFRPVRHQGRSLVDGGLRDRLGESALADDERVLLHILPHRPGSSGRRPPIATIKNTATRLSLHIPDLPAISPRDLSMGQIAIDQARTTALAWLKTTANTTTP